MSTNINERLKIISKILLLLFLISQYTYAQRDSLKFKISTNYLDGISHFVSTKTIKYPKSKIDIFFYKNHFAEFYGLHKKTIERPRLKNQKIREWKFDNKPKELTKNWLEIYTYNSKGKLIEYKYSGCKICSQFSYGYKLFYNQNGDIIEQQYYYINNKFYLKEGELFIELDFKKEKYRTIKLTYDVNRNIIRLEEFSDNKTQKLIEIIK